MGKECKPSLLQLYSLHRDIYQLISSGTVMQWSMHFEALSSIQPHKPYQSSAREAAISMLLLRDNGLSVVSFVWGSVKAKEMIHNVLCSVWAEAKIIVSSDQ